MRSIVYIISVLVFPYKSFAQADFFLFGGAQAVTARYSVNGIGQANKYKTGFQVGAGGKVFFDNNLYFAPVINYGIKGYYVDLNTPAYPPDLKATNNDVTLHTLDIAPLMQVNFGKNPTHLFLKFGPSIDIVFAGKESFDTLGNGGGNVSRNMRFAFTDYGRFTGNAIAHLGFETAGRFIIFAHYLHGLGSLNNHDGGPRIKHRNFGVSAGFYLGTRKLK